MKILHLLSNRKWTERAEPAADLALAQKALGHDVAFACARWTLADGHDRSVEAHARDKGLEPHILELPKHFSLPALWKDGPRLRALAAAQATEVIHIHMENAHLTAALAFRSSSRRPLLVRQSYDALGPPAGFRARRLLQCHTDGLITISESARTAARQRFHLEPARVATIAPGIDLERFHGPTPPPVEDGPVVAGMVTRIRGDRRPELLVEALALLAGAYPRLRALIVGRGEAAEDLRKLAAARGVEERVEMPGYLAGDDLVQAYARMDIFVYPVPGTDQSCRAVREAMAMGLPVVAGRTGFLPELVTEGETGRLVATTPAALAEVLKAFCADAEARRRMGRAARRHAEQRFQLADQAARTLDFYARCQEARIR